MSKINLLKFSENFIFEGITYWQHTTGSSGAISPENFDPSISNKDFEEKVINTIINWKTWKSCPEFELLSGYFKKGGKLETIQNLYNNTIGLKTSMGGKGYDIFYLFSKNVLKGRFPEDIEKLFLRDIWQSYRSKRVAYKYAKYVVRNRLPVEFEKDCDHVQYIDFLKTKGVDISSILINNTSLCYSYYRTYNYLPEIAHNYMIAMKLTNDRYCSLYFIQRKKDDKLIKNRLQVLDSGKTIKEVLDSM